MSAKTRYVLLFLILVSSVGCTDSTPQVDFLTLPSFQQDVKPGSPSSVNLSPTTTVSGGVYQLKGRVSTIATQNELTGGTYKIKGKISF